MPTPINERKEYMTQRIVVKKADLAILKRWIAAESDHSSDTVIDCGKGVILPQFRIPQATDFQVRVKNG